MTLIRHREVTPSVDASAFVAHTALLIGRVRVNAHSRILHGAILNSEASSIEVGQTTIISENAVLRATGAGEIDTPVVLGDHVFVGPHATLLGCTVEECTFIATGATVLQGATVRPGGVVGVGALVHSKTIIPPEFFVPPNAVAIGDPVMLYGPDDGEAMLEAIKALGFSRTAFGVEVTQRDRASIYHDVTKVRSREYAAHLGDVVLTDDWDPRDECQ